MKKILLISDAAAGQPAAAKPEAPICKVDASPILADCEKHITTLAADKALPPLLSFALSNLRGAANALKGHIGKAAALLLFLLLLAMPASAQVFYGGVTVIGSSNSPVLVNFTPITNTASSSLYPRVLLIQNVVSNSTVTASYGYQWAGLGGTNLFLQNTITTNFNGAGLANGSTVIIYLPAFQNNVPIQPWGTYSCTNASGNVTNVVSFF